MAEGVLPGHPAVRRRLIARTGLRVFGLTLGMLALYAFVPVPGSSGAAALLVVVFAFTYLTLSRADPASFSEQLDRVDAMYYTVSTVATVGLGDITPASEAARILLTFQMLFDLALIAGLVRLVILATRTGLRRQNIDADA